MSGAGTSGGMEGGSAARIRREPDNLRGIAGVLGAGLFMICSDACLRAAMAEMPLGQVIFGRGLVACLILSVVAAATGVLRWHRALTSLPVVIRILCEIGAALFFITAIARMPFANATAIIQLIPIMSTIMAAMLFREAVGWQRWLASALGFLGVMLIIQPGAEGFNWWSLIALAAMVCMSTRDVATSRMDPTIPTLLVGAVSAAAVTLSGLALVPLAPWPAPSPYGLALVSTAGVLLAAGFTCLVLGMRAGEVAAVAPFRYGTMLWALIIGIVVWDELPGPPAIAGIVIVIAAGLFTLRREHRLHRQRSRGIGGRQ